MATHTQSLQRAYRKMILELAEELHENDCRKIIHLEALPPPDSSNFCLSVLSLLESHGHTSPRKVDHLESLLSDIHRLDLLPIVTRYKESKEFKHATITKRRKEVTADTELEPVGIGSEKKKMVKFLYTLLISHTTELTQILEILGELMEKEESVERAVEQFQKVAKDGEEFAESLHKVFKSMGISTSSEETCPAEDMEKSLLMLKPDVLSRQCSPANDSCWKPVPHPRTKAPSKSPQISEHTHGPIQEEGFAPTLPNEEATYEDGVEAEEDQDDSGIGYAADWIGHRTYSNNLLKPTTSQHGGHS